MNRSSPGYRRRAARGVLGIVGLTCILSGPEAPDARAQGAPKAPPAPAAKPAPGLAIPVVVRKLANGLTVVVSEDHSTPTFGVSTVYRIGFRLEPKGRTGFAHLFEHLMFEGSQNAPKGTLDRVIEGGAHFPWIERPGDVREAFHDLADRILRGNPGAVSGVHLV